MTFWSNARIFLGKNGFGYLNLGQGVLVFCVSPRLPNGKIQDFVRIRSIPLEIPT
jgi:hypothetical protein